MFCFVAISKGKANEELVYNFGDIQSNERFRHNFISQMW